MAHARKRQFQSSNQSSITSFFSATGTSSPSSSTNLNDAAPSLRPALPDNVQSLLINVGMRVRKSVPEGYKTHKSLPVPTISYMHPASISTNTDNEQPASSAPELYTKPSELTPFCGLHKIGGFGSQPTSSVPGLSYSQSTISSSAPMPQTPKQNTRKRSYADEIEDDLDKHFEEDDEQHDSLLDAAVSPKTRYPLSHSSMPKLGAQTGIVNPESRPKARIKKRSPEKSGISVSSSQDFADEDVGFLQPMDCD